MSERASERQGAVGDVELAWQTARYQNAARTALETVTTNPGFDRVRQELDLRIAAVQIALRVGREERLIPAYEAVQYAVGTLRLPFPIEHHFEQLADIRATQAAEDFSAGIDRGEDPQLIVEDDGMLLAAGVITPDELLTRLGIDSSGHPQAS